MIKIFLKLVNQFLNNLSKKELKLFLNRKRLKSGLSISKIAFYLLVLFLSTYKTERIKKILKKRKIKKIAKSLDINNLTYQNIMKNINTVSILFQHMFYFFNKMENIHFDKLNIIDSSDIVDRETNNYKFNEKHRYVKKGQSVKIGVKLFAIINSRKQICVVNIFDINQHDSKVLLKNSGLQKMKNNLFIADKGFNSKKNRLYFEENGIHYIMPVKKNALHYDKKVFYGKNEVLFTTNVNSIENIKNCYKNRFKIEEVFLKIKNPFEKGMLFLKGGYNFQIKKAKIYISCLIHNIRNNYS